MAPTLRSNGNRETSRKRGSNEKRDEVQRTAKKLRHSSRESSDASPVADNAQSLASLAARLDALEKSHEELKKDIEKMKKCMLEGRSSGIVSTFEPVTEYPLVESALSKFDCCINMDRVKEMEASFEQEGTEYTTGVTATIVRAIEDVKEALE